jgi:hypothetical protein
LIQINPKRADRAPLLSDRTGPGICRRAEKGDEHGRWDGRGPGRGGEPVADQSFGLNVRDIEESHKFWTEIVGFKQVAALRSRPERPNLPKMRFYSAVNDGKLTHHTVALVVG